MGRLSALTENQWEEIRRRHAAGEKGRVLAREFGIGESTLREKVSAQSAQVKAVVNQIVAADASFRALPISAQISARTLADERIAISMHLSGAARFGASTAHRLAAIANAQAMTIDDDAPLTDGGIKAMQTIAILTKTANDAASTGIELIKANKEQLAEDMRQSDVNLQEMTQEQFERELARHGIQP